MMVKDLHHACKLQFRLVHVPSLVPRLPSCLAVEEAGKHGDKASMYQDST